MRIPLSLIAIAKLSTAFSCNNAIDAKQVNEPYAKEFKQAKAVWKVEDGWLIGENKGNWLGMAILKQDFLGNELVEFEAQTVLPSSHDTNDVERGVACRYR